MSSAPMPLSDPLGICGTLSLGDQRYTLCDLGRLAERLGCDLAALPYCVRLLLEALARGTLDGRVAPDEAERAMRALLGGAPAPTAYLPARVLLQDFTGVPVLVDLAAMREAVRRLGGDPARVNPVVPTDVVVDHSIQVDLAGRAAALAHNTEREFERNRERYTLLRWGQQVFQGLRVFPPGTGIVHQINMEHLATLVQLREHAGGLLAFPDSVCGTDSHTTMINGLGVLGWGVGGIEAEAVMLGRPLMMLTPAVVGVHLTGRLAPGVTATDLALTLTERLRREGVVGHFVEFYGAGLERLSLADRATVANMAPEYGATCAYFPVDAESLRYLRATGRPPALVELVERYYRAQGLFRSDDAPAPAFGRRVEFDLAAVGPSLAGPARPQDHSSLAGLRQSWAATLAASGAPAGASASLRLDGQSVTLTHGSIVLAAITSCTNTSNPTVMVAAGLLARNAVARGLRVPPFVKTSLSPGSRVVSDYLDMAGLTPALETLGFHVVGYGCMTCSGSSGPLDPRVAAALREHSLLASAVLSGNRNFEGRIHPLVRANYLASPPLVVAYALAGTVDIDLEREPLGRDGAGAPVYLRDLWPSDQEIAAVVDAIGPELFRARYQGGGSAEARWQAIAAPAGDLYDWDAGSTYIRRPPYFEDMALEPPAARPLSGARVLALLGDSITTDHLSPAGAIDPDSPAGRYLADRGVAPKDFNSYGARRGNHEAMMRGTLANPRLKNLLLPGVEGGLTRHLPSGEVLPIYEAALRYAAERTPLLVLAGKEYGAGSSRDWAAKGPRLLGVRAVIAESFERIHRSNLVSMGVLPLEFPPGQSWRGLGLDGSETYTVEGLADLRPGQELAVRARRADGHTLVFAARARIDSASELACYRNGGILPLVVRDLMAEPR